MKFCVTFLPLLCASFAITPLQASPQTPQPRLQRAIGEGTRAVLAGSSSPRTLHAQDLGAAPGDQPLPGITLVFRRSAAQQADLDHLLAAQQDPASPEFHYWLTPEAFGRRFGMADADLEATQRWLTSHGFTIDGVSRARDRITFSGTSAQVAATFGATLHHYQIDGEPHLAPNSDLTLPADLAAVTSDVLHLSDFRPHPNAHPAFTAAADQSHYLTPEDLEVMYHLPSGTASDYTSGVGQSIAIVGESYVDTSGSGRFRSFSDAITTLSLFGVLVPNSGVEAITPGGAAETEIDLEYAGGIAPAANVFLVHVGSNPNYGAFDALAFAIDQNLAPVISISYSQCETLLSSTELEQGNALFQQATAQGQTLVAASGDSGSTACIDYSTYGSFSVTQQQALAVNYPADSPYVTAVGGTQMAAGTFTSGDSVYWNPALYSMDLVPSLISYVPEVAWNEDSTFSIFAGGGGASTAYPRATWQSDVPGIPAGAARLIPDVALQSSSQNPGFLLCTDDASFLASEGQLYGCQAELRADNGQYTSGGGTSFAAPVVAAMTALINQARHELGQGNLNPTLYQLASSPSAGSSAFHDVTAGSIACTSGSPGCSAAGQAGFAAAPGYDQATGLGSIDFAHLLAAWPTTTATSLQATQLQAFPSEYSSAPGAFDPLSISVYVPATVTGVPPTGGLTVTVDGAVVTTALAFASTNAETNTANASFLFTAPQTSGYHIIVVTYPGDATHGPSSATVPILVGSVVATGSITLAAGNVTLPPNGSATSAVIVTPSGGYNGRLFWSLSLSGGDGSSTTACYSIPTLPVQGPSSTTLSLGVGTACSSALPSARGTRRPLAVHTAANPPHPSPWPHPRSRSALPIAAGLALCCFLPASRRRRLIPLLCLLLTAAVATLSGCGGGSSAGSGSSNPIPATPAVAYTATLTATDSVTATISSSTTFTLTVQ